QMHVAWLISPGMCILGLCQFCDKFVERRVAVAYAGAIPEYCVEGCGIAVIQQPDLFVTLNGACARSQTQESDRRQRRPNQGPKMRLSFHAEKTSLFGSARVKRVSRGPTSIV